MSKKLFKKFLRNTRGNFGMTMAVAMLPLMTGVGAAIDFARVTSVATRLQDAADSAAVRGAIAKTKNEANMQDLARKNFDTNKSQNEALVINSFQAVAAENTVTVKVDASIKPLVMQIFNIQTLNVSVESEARYGSGVQKMEIAIALDATGSMGFGNRWNDAMNSMEDILDEVKVLTGDASFNVMLIPFRDRVNIGTHRSAWLNAAAPAGWNGCVEPREEKKGNFNWFVDADNHLVSPFTASIPGVTGGLSNYQSQWSPNPSPICPNVRIVGPTNDPSDISREAKKLWQEGTGRFEVGLAWAWRALSPKWNRLWTFGTDFPSSSPNTRKFLIFITDGNSIAYNFEMSQEEDLGFNNGSTVGFQHLEAVCEEVKKDNIEIFVLQPDGNPHSVPYLQRCASSEDHYFRVNSVADFTDAFGTLKTNIESQIYVSR